MKKKYNGRDGKRLILIKSFVNLGLRMTEVKTRFNTEIAKSTAS